MTPFSPSDLSPELATWIERAGGRVSVDPARWPGVYVALSTGEVSYVVERFLANAAGYRAEIRDTTVRVPFELHELPPGAELQRLSDGPLGGFERLAADGVVFGDFGFGPQGSWPTPVPFAPPTTGRRPWRRSSSRISAPTARRCSRSAASRERRHARRSAPDSLIEVT